MDLKGSFDSIHSLRYSLYVDYFTIIGSFGKSICWSTKNNKYDLKCLIQRLLDIYMSKIETQFEVDFKIMPQTMPHI